VILQVSVTLSLPVFKFKTRFFITILTIGIPKLAREPAILESTMNRSQFISYSNVKQIQSSNLVHVIDHICLQLLLVQEPCLAFKNCLKIVIHLIQFLEVKSIFSILCLNHSRARSLVKLNNRFLVTLSQIILPTLRLLIRHFCFLICFNFIIFNSI
jgi:hypothetical protein